MRLKVLINSYGNDLFIVKIYRFTAVGHQVAPTDTCAIVSLERTFSLEETNLQIKTKVKKTLRYFDHLVALLVNKFPK